MSTDYGFNWIVDDDLPKDTIFIFSPDWFVIEGNEILMKREVDMTQWVRQRALSRIVRAYREDKVPYYKMCVDANDIICYKCGNPVKKHVISVKSTSTTVSFRRYYDKECFEKLYQ